MAKCLRVTPDFKIEIVELDEQPSEAAAGETPNLAGTLVRAIVEGRVAVGDAYFPLHDLRMLRPLL